MFCHDVRAVAASSFWLAMKLEEEKGASNRGGKPSKLNDVVSMFEHIRARREGVQPLPPHSPAFKLLKDEVLKLEMRMLIEFGFVCNVEHPHKLLLGILNSLEASKELIQESWNLVNDSLRTTLCVCYPSNVIACGIVFAAARRLSVPLPENPPWWDLFDVSNEQIHSVCLSLADLYRQPKPHYIDVKTLSSQSIDVGSFTEASAGDSVKSSLSPVREISPNCDKPTSSECNDTIPAIDLKSQSEVLNSSFVNGSGSPQLKDAVKDVLKDRDQTSLCSRNSRKRVWDSSFDSVRKGCREFDSSSCHEQKRTARQSHSRSRSRSGRDNHREREHALRHYEHHRCSRYYDNQVLSSRHHYGHVRG
ncbi:hypothetical protein KP509_29G000300 [Ceratopteris richardii]|nr:hypothetical protein KP509_29G000300 [Ceratopteris richardii]